MVNLLAELLKASAKNPTGPWAKLTKEDQLAQTANWGAPFWFANVGLIAYRPKDPLIDTEVLALVNETAEKKGKVQIYAGGFKDPRKDFHGPELAALREFMEETGMIPDTGRMPVRIFLDRLPEVITLDAPVQASVFFDRNEKDLVLRNSDPAVPAYKHPISLTVYATNAPLVGVCEPDGEVSNQRWVRLGDIIEKYGKAENFSYHAVLYAFIFFLVTGNKFRWNNMAGAEYRMDV